MSGILPHVLKRPKPEDVIDLTMTTESPLQKKKVLLGKEKIPVPKEESHPRNAFETMMQSAAPPPPKNAFTTLMSSAAKKEVLPEPSSNSNGKAGGRRRWGDKKKQEGAGGSSSGGGYPKGWVPGYRKIQMNSMSHPIIVDGFQFSNKEVTECYFLSHYHYDHYIGLDQHMDSGVFTCGTIYCTPTTANLLKLRSGVKKGIVAVALETRFAVEVGGQTVHCTFADANHCPGAAVITFEFSNGQTVLHTGDFRCVTCLSVRLKMLCGFVWLVFCLGWGWIFFT